MKETPAPLAVALLALMTVLVAPAQSASVKGVDFPEGVTIDGRECRLNGLGVRTKFFVSVYIGAVYLATPTRDAAALIAADEPKRLVMHFLHSKVTSAQLRETWTEGFHANSAAEMGRIKERVDAYLSYFDEDILKGETIVITYIPGRGTEVAIKGKTRGSIEGADFMKALFAIWFGNVPADKSLKKGMLGEK